MFCRFPPGIAGTSADRKWQEGVLALSRCVLLTKRIKIIFESDWLMYPPTEQLMRFPTKGKMGSL